MFTPSIPWSWRKDLYWMDRKRRIREAKLDPLIGKCRFQHTRASHDEAWAPDLLIEGMPLTWWFRIIRLSDTLKMDPIEGLIECLFFGLETLETQYGILDPERTWPQGDIIRADAATQAVKLDRHTKRIAPAQQAEQRRRKQLLAQALKTVSEYVETMEDSRAQAWLRHHGFTPDSPRN